jgi:pyruvate,water dikinase
MNARSTRYVLDLAAPRTTLEAVGGKGASLARLVAAGLPVPDGYHVTTAAYRRFVDENDLQPSILAALELVDISQPTTLEAASATIRALFAGAHTSPDVAGAIVLAYRQLGRRNPVVAVRSSATAEDLPDASFAGQQETFLNIQGAEQVLEAVKRCWASLWTARAIGYRARQGIDHSAVSLAVVVQALVPAEAAGVLFTANPLTGRRDQATISASWGLGEAVVGGLVTPDALIVDKSSGVVLERQIAEKQVMTARVDGGTEERPVPAELRRTPVLDDESAAELTRLGAQIEELYNIPVDIEWALADGTFFILQARPITALPEPATEPVVEPAVPPAAEWEVPNPRARYLRNNIVELMADPLTPLFTTLGRRVINRSMKRTLTDALGGSGLVPDDLIVTIHGYAYYNGAFTPGQILRILWKGPGIAKRMFTGIEKRWLDARGQYEETVETWQARDWHALSTEEILHAVPGVFGAAIDYYMALVGGLIPAAWMTEGLFTVVYRRLIQRQDDPPAPTYLLGFDSKPIQAEKALYDLAQWAGTHADLSRHLLHTPMRQFAASDAPAPPDIEANVWRKWQRRFQAHLQQYGRTIYDLDFVQPTPADDPTPIVQTLKLFLGGEGTDPHARQRSAAGRREEATQAQLGRLKRLRRRLFRSTLARAQKYAPRREDGLADIGLGYPLVRRMLLEIGQRLTEAGGIAEKDDVFWLLEDEVARAAAALDRGEPVEPISDRVTERKALWRARKRVTPPVSMPLPPRWLQRMLPSQFGVEAHITQQAPSALIKGVACSAGQVTAPARVLHGPEDFDQMAPGEVLVAAITTPAWTPLFAMAAGIVTDVGGPLSHGSIVAREYGIPAVLGTGVATRRIRSGQTIAVDGSQGSVEILQERSTG